ncbi:lactonase family protein [Flavobacterium sp. RHBU_3]|uniref:lactonase family protein n=1 Tax=Flavobacterium sp. RHBU_3 TaxID=3391184 RepID=UPI003984C65F
MKNPSFITLAPNGKTLYSVTDSKTPGAGSVSSYDFNAQTVALTHTSSQSSLGENPVYVSVHPSGKWLACANYTEAGLTLYPINNDGTIGKPIQHITYDKGSGINPKRQEAAHAHCVVFSPDGKQLVVTDLGSDTLWNYSFEPTQNPIVSTTKFTETKIPPGSGPRHITFNKKEDKLYLIEELGGAVEVFNNENGKLTPAQRIPAHEENKRLTAFESSDVHLSPDEKFLYASNRMDENNIAIYSVDSNGQLKIKGYQSTMGNHPRTFTLTPDGNFAIVCNVKSNSVTVFKRDKVTGLLQYTGQEIHIENVTTVAVGSY